ncbi:MAG: glycosyltransferase [Candidatus Omnitrophica bacterium]|nr:glycosyltransferase [Candidatus Omnitrophota bacterium]
MRNYLNDKKIRIAFLVNGLRIGGTERYLLSFLEELPKEKFEFSVFCIADAPLLNDPHYKIDYPVIVNNIKRFSLITCFRFFLYLKKYKPQILHSFLYHSNIFARIMGRLAGIKIVISEERSTNYKKKWLYILLERLTWRLSTTIWVNNVSIKDILVRREKIRPEKIQILLTGIKLPASSQKIHNKRYLNIPEDRFVLGNICRFCEQKNLIKLLEVMKIVSIKIPEAILVLVGDGPLMKILKKFCQENNLEDKVIFTGWRNDISEILDCLDVFVSLSKEEGLSCSVMEAMAKGIPVVASDIPGYRELVIDGVTGRLVPLNDLTAAQAIEELYKKRDKFSQVAMKAKRHIEENFNFQRFAQIRQDLYKELVAKFINR